MEALFPSLPPSTGVALPQDSFSTSLTGSQTGFLAYANRARGANLSNAALGAMADHIAQAAGIPPNVFQALIQEESGFNPAAMSPKGAMGLTQLMPQTARSLGVTNPMDPVQSMEGGARYLASLLARFHSLPLALAAYNAGPGAVAFYGGIPPYPQTQRYVANILRMAGIGT